MSFAIKSNGRANGIAMWKTLGKKRDLRPESAKVRILKHGYFILKQPLTHFGSAANATNFACGRPSKRRNRSSNRTNKRERSRSGRYTPPGSFPQLK